jgi:hypothetical protein
MGRRPFADLLDLAKAFSEMQVTIVSASAKDHAAFLDVARGPVRTSSADAYRIRTLFLEFPILKVSVNGIPQTIWFNTLTFCGLVGSDGSLPLPMLLHSKPDNYLRRVIVVLEEPDVT